MRSIQRIAKFIYSKTYILTILWSFTMFLLFIKTNYYKCLTETKLTDKIDNLFLTIVILFSIVTITNIIFVYFASSNNKKLLKDEINTKEPITFRNPEAFKVLILPLFYIWVFSLSKIIVVLMKKTDDVNFNNYLAIWIALLIFSFYYWIKLKNDASENKRYSIKYTILVGIYTYIIIYWETFVPYLKKIFNLGSCIISDIML